MSRLALKGGTPVRDAKTNPWPQWPVWDQREERALLEVLHSGVWSYNGPRERQFNEAFARFHRDEVRPVRCERDRHPPTGPGSLRDRIRR